MALLLQCTTASAGSHRIYDYKADIRDLDVGDLDDMESDVPHMFLEQLKKRKEPQMSMDQIQKDPMAFANNQGGAGLKMMFAVLTMRKAEQLQKKGTDELASAWNAMLRNGGVNANLYAVDPGRILLVTNGPGLPHQVQKFVLEQEDIDWFEQDSQRTYPGGRTKPIDSDEERKVRELELGWRQPEKETPKGRRRAKAKAREL